MVSPRFLGPKIFIIFCSPVDPCFLCGLLFSWMGMLFPLWWWMRTGRDLVCQLPGTFGKMSTSKQLLIGQGNMVLLGLCSNIKGVMRGSSCCMSFVTTVDHSRVQHSTAQHCRVCRVQHSLPCFQIEQLGKHVTTVRQPLETDEEALLIADETTPL